LSSSLPRKVKCPNCGFDLNEKIETLRIFLKNVWRPQLEDFTHKMNVELGDIIIKSIECPRCNTKVDISLTQEPTLINRETVKKFLLIISDQLRKLNPPSPTGSPDGFSCFLEGRIASVHKQPLYFGVFAFLKTNKESIDDIRALIESKLGKSMM